MPMRDQSQPVCFRAGSTSPRSITASIRVHGQTGRNGRGTDSQDRTQCSLMTEKITNPPSPATSPHPTTPTPLDHHAKIAFASTRTGHACILRTESPVCSACIVHTLLTPDRVAGPTQSAQSRSRTRPARPMCPWATSALGFGVLPRQSGGTT